LQTEYSLFCREPEGEVLRTVRELGIGFVAYSPLGRGLLTGAYQGPQDFDAEDRRPLFPRFQGENFRKNLALVEAIAEIARRRNATSAQVALAWVLGRGTDIVPIFGTKRRAVLDQNLAALDVTLSNEEQTALEKIARPDAIAGDRYPDMSLVNR
jgi:aryl-alcohol dehydrogenase-like predicted oxidoreductase